MLPSCSGCLRQCDRLWFNKLFLPFLAVISAFAYSVPFFRMGEKCSFTEKNKTAHKVITVR